MKDVSMITDWRTIQLFLDVTGVAEVQVDSLNPSSVRCDCKGEGTTRCAHVKHVKKTMDANDGHYTIHIPVEVDEDITELAMGDSAAFRDFIIKYGKVEVL